MSEGSFGTGELNGTDAGKFSRVIPLTMDKRYGTAIQARWYRAFFALEERDICLSGAFFISQEIASCEIKTLREDRTAAELKDVA